LISRDKRLKRFRGGRSPTLAFKQGRSPFRAQTRIAPPFDVAQALLLSVERDVVALRCSQHSGRRDRHFHKLTRHDDDIGHGIVLSHLKKAASEVDGRRRVDAVNQVSR